MIVVHSTTGTKIQNVSYQCESAEEREETNQRLVSYLLGTKADYIQVRYGGVSFGHVRSEVSECLDARNMEGGDDWLFLATRQAAKAWHSFKGFHALPAYVNTLSNSILRAHMNDSVSEPVGEWVWVCTTVRCPYARGHHTNVFFVAHTHALSCLFEHVAASLVVRSILVLLLVSCDFHMIYTLCACDHFTSTLH